MVFENPIKRRENIYERYLGKFVRVVSANYTLVGKLIDVNGSFGYLVLNPNLVSYNTPLKEFTSVKKKDAVLDTTSGGIVLQEVDESFLREYAHDSKLVASLREKEFLVKIKSLDESLQGQTLNKASKQLSFDFGEKEKKH